jgi:DNA polymerase-3 subunit delta'
LLIHGRPGLGKTILARRFAQYVLCEGAQGEAPCGRCPSCVWFAQRNHPDFRAVEPEALAPLEEGEGERRSEKEPSRQIKIEQIRDLERVLAIGTHRQGLRVILIRPAEAMNWVTSNALLKNLEEPPPGTLFLLVSSAPERLLPTVRSRCQAIAVAAASDTDALGWLKEQGVREPAEALAYASHAPLAALESESDRVARDAFIGRLTAGEIAPLELTESCQGIAPGTVLGWLQRWTFDLALARFTGDVRYHLRQGPALQRLAAGVAPEPLLGFARSLAADLAVAEHPLNPRLFIESVLLRYAQLWGTRDV